MPKRNFKIAIVEDDLAMRELIAHKLQAKGYSAREAKNGSEGFLLIEQEKPDLILLDLMMPIMDGFEVLKRLRGHPDKKLAQTPVVVLSNKWSKEDILRAQSFKVEEYLIKALFTPDEILGKIEAVLEKRGTRAE